MAINLDHPADTITPSTGALSISGNLSYTGTLTGGTGVVNLGSGQFYKDASGNVGIGTSSPSRKLTIVESANNSTGIQVTNSNAGTGSQATVAFSNGTNANAFGIVGTNYTTYGCITASNTLVYAGSLQDISLASDGGNIKFGTGVGVPERMRIDSSGNVGIGITNPAYKLVVSNAGAEGIEFGAGYSPGKNIFQNYNRSTTSYVELTSVASTFVYQISGTERMRIDSSGNLLVGKSASYRAGKLVVAAANVTQTSTTANLHITTTDTQAADVGGSLGLGGQVGGDETPFGYISGRKENSTSGNYAGYLAFATQTAGGAVAERMRIDSSGNLLVGTTSAPADNAAIDAKVFRATDSYVLGSHRGTTAAAPHYYFFNTNGLCGKIETSGSNTTYVTSSDYRLKENVAPMTGALDVVQALKPVIYNWKVDGSDGQGFIAHELQSVVPDCVTGEKDAVDAEGKPVYQGIDTSFLVATLTAAIQELNAKVTALEAQLGAK